VNAEDVESVATVTVARVVGLGREVGSRTGPFPRVKLGGPSPDAKEASGIPDSGSAAVIEGPPIKGKVNVFAYYQRQWAFQRSVRSISLAY
jgi:hypothetical protein